MKNALKLLCLLFLLVAMPSCSDDSDARVPAVAPSSADTAAQEAKDKAAQDQIAALRGDNGLKPKTTDEADKRIAEDQAIIKAAQESIATLKNQKQEIIVEARQEKIYWLSGILGFASIGLIVLAIFSPVERANLLKLAGVASALAALLLYVAEWAAYFEVIGFCFLVLLVAVLVVTMVVHGQVIQRLIADWKAYAAKVPADVKAELDKASVAAQPSHVKAFIDKMLALVHKI